MNQLAPAIRWVREYSPRQYEFCRQIQRTWEDVMRERGDAGHAYPLQLTGGGHVATRAKATVGGEELSFHVVIRTLKLDFAAQVFRRAIARTEQRYPGWNAHRYVDGPQVGERRIEWLSKAFPFGASRLGSEIFNIIRCEEVAATEFVRCEPCDGWGRRQHEYKKPLHAGDKMGERLLELCVDVESVDEAFARELLRPLEEAGVHPSVKGVRRSFSYQEVCDLFVAVSDPDIALINRADARAALSEADRALFAACEVLDEAGMEAAIADGANCNAIDEDENTPLALLVMANGFNRYALYESEEGEQMTYTGKPPVNLSEADELRLFDLLLRHGAHPDLAGLDELAPLGSAALMRCPHVVRRLLDVGADAGMHTAFDRSFGGWPDAWDYASFHAWRDGGLYQVILETLKREAITPYDDDSSAAGSGNYESVGDGASGDV